MEGRVKTGFCTYCRKEAPYFLKKRTVYKTIKGKEYLFSITVAVCTECGEEMGLPGLIDKNIQEIDEQYRFAEGIVTVDDIKTLMKIYKLGKSSLSLALGFGEITISRYLSGQIPSKEYSEIMKKALASPEYMKQCLVRNKNKITDTAFQKAMEAVSELEGLFCVSKKMLKAISYMFNGLKEITPLMLQKLLYFTQGIYLAVYGKPIFVEDCEAWVHGPVYADVYNLFKDFKYNPIEDARFAIFDWCVEELSDEEAKVIDLVLKTFGLYGGKVLEEITHNEKPWKEARKGYEDTIPSHEIISKNSIKTYYTEINKKYNIASENGLIEYIQFMRQKAL